MDWEALFWSTVTVLMYYYPTRLVALAILCKISERSARKG